MLIKKDFPDVGELVVCTVKKVQNFGAFVGLDEYPGREGFIHIAEVATGWIKRIRDHVRENQKVVCKVMHVDKAKGHIDLSLKRVNAHQRREKIQEWKNEQKAIRLFEILAKNLGRSVEDCYKEFGKKLIEKYGTLYAAFEECAYNVETLKNDGFKGDWLKEFDKIAKENIVIPFVNIKGYLKIESWLPDAIVHIKNALLEGEKSEYEDVDIEISYAGAPRYAIKVTAPDYKIAENELKKAVERVSKSLEGKAEVSFSREGEEKH
jgi:translation initiation factor 2 subunit 1